jgi:hypothetical protein
MSDFTKVFTDAVKDVIGNDPVLDQFDITYNASFYGTMQDDYVTGSMLSVVKSGGRVTLTQGLRGKLLSKYSSHLFNPDYGADVNKIPQLSYRQVPWQDRLSRSSNRVMQCYDANERYYDSCIPDVNTCFQANGARTWVPTSEYALSPVGNIESSNTGLMFFNTVPLSRSSEEFDNDPTVNNEWTWSFPYETKYSPEKRLVKTSNTLGLNYTNLTVDWSYELSSSYFNSWNLTLDNLTELDKDKTRQLNGFIPILPGKLDKNVGTPIEARNGLRGVFSGSVPYNVPAIYGIDSTLDNDLGVSFLIPADVDLSKIATSGELVTGSMTTDDTVKFLFGFGDLNNMTYARYNISQNSDSYEEDFELPAEYRTYYFWSALNSAESTKQTNGYDRALDRSSEGTVTTITRTSGTPEFYDSGWHPISVDASSSDVSDRGTANSGTGGAIVWITDNSEPNVTSIAAGTWNFKVNAYASSALQFRALIYKWDGFSKTLIGTSSTVTLSTAWGYYTMPWTISSPISLLATDRILVKLQVNFTGPNQTVYFSPRRTYNFIFTRYSSIETNIAVSYNANTLYTKAYELGGYSQSGLTVDWSNSPTVKPWSVIYRSGSTTINSTDYNFWGPAPLSGAVSPNNRGLFGPSDTNNNFILYTSGSYESSPTQEYSVCRMDITSNYPWTLSYDRAVAGYGSYGLVSYLTGSAFDPSASPTGLVLESLTGSNNDPGTSPPPPKFYYDMFETFDSGLQYGGTSEMPTTFPPGTWRIEFNAYWVGNSLSGLSNEYVMAGIDNISIKTFQLKGDTDGPKIGGNNYPQFRTYRVDPRPNASVTDGTSLNQAATKGVHESYVFGVSPVIRGWKYGLYSGLPMNSKAVFRRNRYGQLRDMLEQRQYTKFINIEDSPVSDDATTRNSFNKFTQSKLLRTVRTNNIGPAVAEVGFFRQRYRQDERKIGYIYNEKVDPMLTTSQNLSSEVTSSLPYFDGVAKIRQESDLSLITDATLTSLQIDTTGLTVT